MLRSRWTLDTCSSAAWASYWTSCMRSMVSGPAICSTATATLCQNHASVCMTACSKIASMTCCQQHWLQCCGLCPTITHPGLCGVAHPAGEASKGLARCYFDFVKKDLEAACRHLRTLKVEWQNLSDEALVKLLPLKTFKRTVRRIYLPRDVQAARLNTWMEDYIIKETAFVDTSVAGQARPLVRGGAEGKDKFLKMWADQMQLVHKGMLSGECCAWYAAPSVVWVLSCVFMFEFCCAMLCCDGSSLSRVD